MTMPARVCSVGINVGIGASFERTKRRCEARRRVETGLTLFTAIINDLPLLTERMQFGLVDSGFLAFQGFEVFDTAVKRGAK
jgi:hypothetical protein